MRTLAAVTALLFALPGAAHAEGGPDLVGSMAQMAGSLMLVIGIILILYYLAGRLLKMPQGNRGGYIRVVETKHLAPKKSLMLVEVGGEYLLLSNSGEGVTLIKQVEMLEEIEVVPEGVGGLVVPDRLKDKLAALKGVLPRREAPLAQLRKSGGCA
ncbi:flagellar biosynthetic protein FliO [Geomonas ferrireducens]|uniref:flagellar biosynthetic protein FliO n=1 Tax=Geomonas ferrireducens TaxID=2570227 RepID=UPI0010A7E46E|nr:flagellar biosynthetic protein FliO [Geomonas ferrireducens]